MEAVYSLLFSKRLIMANDGIIISDTAPTGKNKYTWLRILPDGTREWYEPDDDSWQLVKTEPACAELDHSHPEHGDINFTGTVSADGDAGLTGQRTLAGYTLTFKKGLLVGFQAP